MTHKKNPYASNPVGTADRRAQMHRWMARALAALVISTLTGGPAVAQTTAAEKTTLKELVISALQTHELVEIADSEIRRAQADKKLARSAIMPKGSGSCVAPSKATPSCFTPSSNSSVR